MEPLSLFQPAAYGVNTSDEPTLFNSENAGRFALNAGNMRIHNNRWRTAFRWRELEGYGAGLETWQAGHTQAALWYDPRSGQGAHYLGVGEPRIVESSAGRMFTLTPKNDIFEVVDVSGGNVAQPNLMLAWMAKGENYVIRTDGRSRTQIWDGRNPVQFSTGYNRTVKDASRFPNGAGPTIYAGGRFWTVLFGRRIYASNSLHQLNQTNASDLLRFTDQTYDFINVYFAPPADDDDIVALAVSVNSGFQDSRAQGEVLAFCGGPTIWAVQLGVPRPQWPVTDMRRSRSKETAPSGPGAFVVRDGDIMMRTSKGIESMNLLARERNTLGNPAINLGVDMKAILDRDDEQLLLFSSMVNPPRWDRMFCTVAPQVSEARHWHLGWISTNFNPLGQRVPQGFAWEGVGTLPKAMGRIVQFIFARVEGRSRVFAILDKNGVSKGLAELTLEEGPNLLADGTSSPQRWFLLSKRLTAGGTHRETSFGNAWLRLDDMTGPTKVDVWVRTSQHLAFKLVRRMAIETTKAATDVFGCAVKADRTVSLGKITEEFKGYQWAQFLVTGTGVCSPDIIVRGNAPGAPEEKPDPDCLIAESRSICAFDPFHYALAER